MAQDVASDWSIVSCRGRQRVVQRRPCLMQQRQCLVVMQRMDDACSSSLALIVGTSSAALCARQRPSRTNRDRMKSILKSRRTDHIHNYVAESKLAQGTAEFIANVVGICFHIFLSISLVVNLLVCAGSWLGYLRNPITCGSACGYLSG